MAPADAAYIFADHFPSDQFLTYAFSGRPVRVDTAIEDVIARARSCLDLRLRVSQRGFARGLPAWALGEVDSDQVVVHDLAQPDWAGCLTALGEMMGAQLDPRRALWRLHLFDRVYGVPAQPECASTVAILQVSHALCDGNRSAALAGVLFGRLGPVPDLAPRRVRWPIARAAEALYWNRRLIRDTEAGRVPPPATIAPVLSINNMPAAKPIMRTVTLRRTQLQGPSVTVAALVAVSEALSGYLGQRREDASSLTALVPMARPGVRYAGNHAAPAHVRLHPDVQSRQERGRLISAGLAACRDRLLHPAFAAEERALAALPGPLLRGLLSRVRVPSRAIVANTALSSVNRGPADLSFGGCPVTMTAGYPFLSPHIGLTHGVHGIGDTVAISVHTTETAVPDIDDYMQRLIVGLQSSR